MKKEATICDMCFVQNNKPIQIAKHKCQVCKADTCQEHLGILKIKAKGDKLEK